MSPNDNSDDSDGCPQEEDSHKHSNKPDRNSPEAIKERLGAGLYLQMILEEEERNSKQKKER